MDPRLPSLDELIVAFDKGLRTVFAPAQSVRPTPGASLPESGLTAAITVLAGLIAKASMLNAIEAGPAAMDPAGAEDRGDD